MVEHHCYTPNHFAFNESRRNNTMYGLRISVAGSGPRTDQGPQSGPGPNPARTGLGPIASVQSCGPSPVCNLSCTGSGPQRTGQDQSLWAPEDRSLTRADRSGLHKVY